MTTKEKILLYFRDINYAYNDCTRLDSLEKGLSELEEVVRCKDCRWQGDDEHCPVCNFCGRGNLPSGDWFCADGGRKDDDKTQ